MTGPANGSRLMLPATLDWADDANPQSYELQIGTDPTFQQANQAECTGVEWCVRTIPESQWTIPNLDTGVHYWRVRSEHGDRSPTEPALSAWSAVRSFTMLQTPPRIKGLSTDTFTGSLRGVVFLDPFLPPAGTTVTLASSNPAVAAVPANVLVEKPCCLDFTEAVGTFPIVTGPVAQRTTVTITATLPTGSVSTEVTVDPPA